MISGLEGGAESDASRRSFSSGEAEGRLEAGAGGWPGCGPSEDLTDQATESTSPSCCFLAPAEEPTEEGGGFGRSPSSRAFARKYSSGSTPTRSPLGVQRAALKPSSRAGPKLFKKAAIKRRFSRKGFAGKHSLLLA